jgi:hypothetical protein
MYRTKYYDKGKVPALVRAPGEGGIGPNLIVNYQIYHKPEIRKALRSN